MSNEPEMRQALQSLLAHARAQGADAGDAALSVSESLSVSVRMGALEEVERSENRAVSLRAFIGKKQAGATTSDVSPAGLAALAERVVAMAKAAPEDPYCGLLDPEDRGGPYQAIDKHDPTRPDAATLERLALEAEEAALAIAGITNSSGAGASWGSGHSALMTSDGFYGVTESSSFGFSVSPLAERDGKKERDWDGRWERFFADLPAPDSIGRKAGERAVARLGSRKIESRTAPVIFENRLATRLIGPLLGAISGAAIARGVSFLKDKLGEPVFAPHMTIEDDPHRLKGHASRAFDGEGAVGQKRNLIDKGVLTTWLLNAAAARQLGLKTTGHASWGHGGPPGISSSNVTVLPGEKDLAGLMRDAGEGLLVTEMFSPSLNSNTGDWSVGVAGFWFENGQIAFPVSEVTVGANLKDIFMRLVPGSDLEFRGGANSPSLLADGLAIGGV